MSLLEAFIEDELLRPPPVSDQGGTFIALREIWICYRTDGGSRSSPPVGSGTQDDPYDGSSAAKFDAIMQNAQLVPSGSTIRLGPGIFGRLYRDALC
jgi:hypothetical protein